MNIFFSVGDPSGDVHAANLIRSIRKQCPEAQFVGFGGPKMTEAGCDLLVDLTELAVMWFLRAILNIHKFLHYLWMADRYFRDHRPDAVVLVDFPGFNWWVARKAKRRGIPVFYHAPPQIWAWGSWRINKMRRFVDHVLCSLPFEKNWYDQQGCNATYIGHPFFDELEERQLDQAFIEAQTMEGTHLVTILPGSRTQEVTQNLAAFVRTAEVIHRQLPETRFAVACFKPLHARLAREIVEKRHLPIEIHVGRTPELIHAADCCMAVSGSVSLELLYHTKPTVVLYSLSRIAFWVQNQFRRVKYITLVNLLATDELFPEDLTPYDPGQKDAEKVLFPEYLTCEDRSDQIAAHIIGWLVKPRQREALIERLKTHRDEIAHGGSSASAAEYILSVLRPDPAALPKPHFSDGARHGNPEMAEEELPRDSAIEASSSDPPSIPESKPGHRRDEAA